jgi:FAD/FMN-containing dehydrogenase/ferredoxin
MTDRSYFESLTGVSFEAFAALGHDRRPGVMQEAVKDLHAFFDDARPLESRDAPGPTRAFARALHDAVSRAVDSAGRPASASLAERIVTDAFLRAEADRDQNVYLGKLFTRTLTNAVPDLIFQPVDLLEAAAALRWAREAAVPVTLRGAASTAMGGAVPHDGGLTLDVSRLDAIEPDLEDGTCVLGAGARLRTVHERLARDGKALRVYPSNLGGTFAGWFVTGGIGMNAYAGGRALDSVVAADVVLPDGAHVRFHREGRVDVPETDGHRRLEREEAEKWFAERGQRAIALEDLAGSEGVLGLILALTVEIESLPSIGAFLLEFDRRDDALAAIEWLAAAVGEGLPAPGNVKLLSASHMHHVRRVWRDEAAREWRSQPGALSGGGNLPWTRVAGPAELGAQAGAPEAIAREDDHHGAAYLFVDFLSLEAARSFASRVGGCPGAPRLDDSESRRFGAERFKPQQSKRLGPGLLAAEILMPASRVPGFLPAAEQLARRAGLDLDAEVYYLADRSALVIAAYLTDHRRGGFMLDLLLAPALLDLAMSAYEGKPYVLGRWQAAWFARKFGDAGAARLRGVKRALDPGTLLNRGVLFGLDLRGPLGAIVGAGFGPMVRLVRLWLEFPPTAWVVRLKRAALGLLPGPAAGRGEPAAVGAAFRVRAVTGEAAAPAPPSPAATAQQASARALHCVNCGECNSVCPIFHESKIRLPQMLTHLGEAVHAGERIGETGATLLDLCMRCGNCEEVCQAGIPHLPLYEVMQSASDRARGRDEEGDAKRNGREKHVAILAALRSSERYMRGFLDVRPGRYIKRAPASLPGMPGYVLLRAENDAGPAATCIHCAACVPVCPTEANREFEGADARWITTDQARCIGCGTCVEVCPANHANGGRTLRVVEAPTAAWFTAIETFERESGGERVGAGAPGGEGGGR